MRVSTFILLFVFCYVECRKTYAPIDKNANLAFINMESGGMRPNPRPAPGPNPAPVPTQAPKSPVPQNTPQPIKPAVPEPVKPAPTTLKPVPEPAKHPSQITPKPVYPTPPSKPITTPGPGSVKQLVTFYDSQGKGSPIRPYSYSQAVKQG